MQKVNAHAHARTLIPNDGRTARLTVVVVVVHISLSPPSPLPLLLSSLAKTIIVAHKKEKRGRQGEEDREGEAAQREEVARA